jgi:hypothetical protein
MMDDIKFGPAASLPDEPQDQVTPSGTPSDITPVSPAVERFQSCRWRATPEDG